MTYELLPLSKTASNTRTAKYSARRSRHRRSCHRWSIRPNSLLTVFKYLLPASLAILFLGWWLYELHVELSFYDKKWVTQEVHTLEPLGGCFNPDRISGSYNASQHIHGPKSTEVQAGMALRMGLDCYDFAGTVQGSTRVPVAFIPGDKRKQFHTYWRADLAPFGPRQEWMLKSFFATQNLATSRLLLWSNGDLSSNELLMSHVRKYPDSFGLRVVDIPKLAKGTVLEGSELLDIKDSRAWIDGDLVRLLLLWQYGGVWVDMDSLLTRSLEPLLEHEFVTQWDCYDKIYAPMNGALMHFEQHSPYLCEAFHVMRISKPPREGSTDWGSLLYQKLWRRLVAENIPPFKILPFCFTDGRACRLDNRLPDPFSPDHPSGKWTMGLGLEKGGGLDKVLNKIFSIHLHGQWGKEFPQLGWVDRLLLKKFDSILQGKGN